MRGQAGNEHRTPGLTRIERTDPGHPAIQVARQLISYLLESRAWKVGDKLPSERELVGTFGVGRSAVREALKSLSLLEIRQGDGAYVRSPHSDLLPQVMEWGLLIEDQKIGELAESRSVIEVALAGFAA